jgi:DegV family protein with EDD domain
VSGIAVVTDSTSDLSPEICELYGISVVPLSVSIGDDTFPDGTLTQAEFFARMAASPTLPTTSQPPVGVFRDAYERALASAQEVVSVHISSRLSGTVEAAREAAKSFSGRVHVIDSLNLSWGLGFQVLEAARAVAVGHPMADVVAAVEAVRDRVQLIVGLDKLDNLAKGGRIGKVTAFLGGVLNMRITFCVCDGEFQPVGRARGAQAILRETLDWITERMDGRRRGAFCVMHAMAPDTADRLRTAIESRFEVAEMHVAETGTVIATHTGTGFGVAFVPLD